VRGELSALAPEGARAGAADDEDADHDRRATHAASLPAAAPARKWLFRPGSRLFRPCSSPQIWTRSGVLSCAGRLPRGADARPPRGVGRRRSRPASQASSTTSNGGWSPDDLGASGRLSARERQNHQPGGHPIALGQEGGSARSRPLLVLGRVAPRREAERSPSPPWGRAELARRSPPGGREPTVSPPR